MIFLVSYKLLPFFRLISRVKISAGSSSTSALAKDTDMLLGLGFGLETPPLSDQPNERRIEEAVKPLRS